MDIQTIDIDKINVAPYNPRLDLRPGDKDYEKLKKSLLEYDLVEPLIWNKTTGNLIGGHQRLKVLKEFGNTQVQVSVVEFSSEKEKALNIALNKISGDWDIPKLKDLLEELDTGAFDMEGTGFDTIEIEQLMTQFHPIEGDLPAPYSDPEFVGLDSRSKYLLLVYYNDEERVVWLKCLGLEKLQGDKRLFTLEDIGA